MKTGPMILRIEKVVKDGQKLFKLAHIENVLAGIDLPQSYLEGTPRMFGSEYNSGDQIWMEIVYGEKGKAESKDVWYKGELRTKEETRKFISMIGQCGKRLGTIMREGGKKEMEEYKKSLEKWTGSFEVKI
jgi:hypothetical protein